MESTGFHWIPPESGYPVGFCWSPVILLDSAGVRLFHWIPPESSGLLSAEKVWTDSVDSARICWFPVDSAGLLLE